MHVSVYHAWRPLMGIRFFVCIYVAIGDSVRRVFGITFQHWLNWNWDFRIRLIVVAGCFGFIILSFWELCSFLPRNSRAGKGPKTKHNYFATTGYDLRFAETSWELRRKFLISRSAWRSKCENRKRQWSLMRMFFVTRRNTLFVLQRKTTATRLAFTNAFRRDAKFRGDAGNEPMSYHWIFLTI